ncbi:MAG TPA: ABC transporter permease [Ilumatobacteraceae bacterium]
MNLVDLIRQNLGARKARSILTGTAVAIGILTIVALGVLTSSLRQTALSVLRIGRADFSVAQEGVSDLLYSAVDTTDLDHVRSLPEVESAIGVLVSPIKLDSDHPLFLKIGVPAESLTEFGVNVVEGRAYATDAQDEIMLGYRAASDLGLKPGDSMQMEDRTYTITGLFSTGQVFGDKASMMPLTALQAEERQPGTVTLLFVRVVPGADIEAVRARIESDLPQVATVKTQTDFGRVDRNLVLINAANLGGSVLALTIGAVGVMNTTLLSFFERTREFGVLRAVGWSRKRIVALVLGEAAMVCLIGAVVGVALGFIAVRLLARLPDLVGIFTPTFSAGVFWRALGFAALMTLLGALYPALRAARREPLEAMRHE